MRSCRSRTSITCIPTGRSRWRRAPTASAKLEEFNARYGRTIVWMPWQRPGFELALMLRRAVEDAPRLRRHPARQPRSVHVGRHAARVLCEQPARRSIRWAQFVEEHARRAGRPLFGGRPSTAAVDRESRRRPRILPYLRGVVSSNRRIDRALGSLRRRADVRRTRRGPTICARSARAVRITSCARASVRCSCRGIRSRQTSTTLQQRIDERVAQYRDDYAAYYRVVRASRTRRRCATRIRRSSSSPASASSASARTSAKRASPPSSSSTRFT